MSEGNSVLITILKNKEHSENRFRRINVRNMVNLKELNVLSLPNITFKIKVKDYDKIAVFELQNKRKVNNEILKKLKKEGFLPDIS